MTPQQIALVQESWEKVVPIAETAADIFYKTLFELDPALRPLFPDDLAEQKKKLMAMLGRVIPSLHKLDTLLDAVADLGARHAGYGVEPSQYDTVGKALLSTLAAGLGDDFDIQTRHAWTAAYSILAGTMIGAAEQQRAAS